MKYLLLLVVFAWFGVVGVLFLAQRWLLYRPDARIPAPNAMLAAGLREIEAHTADGLILRFWHKSPAPGRDTTVVLFQGNAGNAADRLPAVTPLLAAGFGVALAPYRGYGGNPGRPSEQGLYADARAALAALGLAGHPPAHLVLWGESLGSGVATQMAIEHRVRGVILQAPYTAVADRAQELYPFLPARWLVLDRFDNLARIGLLGAPLLIVHGERDEIVPVRHGRALLSVAAEPKRGVFLSMVGHNDIVAPPFHAAIAAFLGEL